MLLASLSTLTLALADSSPGDGTVSGASGTVRLNNASPIPNGKEVVDQFRAAYAAQKPKVLLFVNRELLPSQRLEITAKTETGTQVKGDAVESSGGNTNVQIGNNTQSSNSGGTFVLNPRQTGAGGEKKETVTTYKPAAKPDLGTPMLSEFDARQLEEGFRAPYFAAGTRFVDQRIAASLLKQYGITGDRFLTPPANDAERDAQEALKKSADVAIELLARHYDVTYPTPAGDTVIHRLDLVATAYDLKTPGVVLGQISSESLYGFNQPGGTRRNVTDREIIDQTALALMQQLAGTLGSK